MRTDSINYALVPTLTALMLGISSAQTPPVPAEYQDLYDTLTTQIASFNTAVKAGWNGNAFAYLDAPQLSTAGSSQYTSLLGNNFYTYAVIPELDELKALGAKAVTIHIDFPTFYQPFYTFIGSPGQYQQFVSFYQQLAQDVRARGMKLVVEASSPMPLAGNQFAVFQPYFQSLSWLDYVNGRAANALAVAQLIQPDYLTVLDEPDTEATATGQPNVNTVSGATQLVQQALTTMQQAGVTNIQIGAGAGTWIQNYIQYVQAFAAMPLNYVDMHIYPINGTFFTNALTAADIIHAAGKQVGMTEFWDYKIRDSELGNFSYATILGRDPFSFWEPIDIAFLQAVVNFANYKQLAFISPFAVDYFFAYLDYNTYGSQPADSALTASQTSSKSAILAGAFTQTGHAWESQNIPMDATPPATPAAPTASVIGTAGINLVWSRDEDNVGVSAYNLYRNGSLLSTTSLTLYNDSGLVSGATYTYELTATDASGNVSPVSAPLVVQTVDITPPSVPADLVVTSVLPGAPGSVSMTWTPSTGIGGVGGYWILRGTSPSSMSIHAGVTAPPYTDPYATPSTTYYYEVESYNPLGVVSGPSNQVVITSPAANCSYSVGNLPAEPISAAGGTITVSVTAGTGCNWIAYSASPAAVISSGNSGSGNGNVQITLDPNSSGAPVTFSFIFAGQAISINQYDSSQTPTQSFCGFTVANPSPQSASGGTLSVAITQIGQCSWLASSNASWITPVNSSGTSSGNAAFSVAANSGSTSRAGSITIAGQNFNVVQSPAGLAFYPVFPCRVADTRASQGKTGAFGPPSLSSYVSRDFPILSSGCGIPSSAQAYSLNITVSPSGPLAWLSTWPAGQSYSGVSTLNSVNGSLIANAAIVPAGTSGSITVEASNPTDVIIDINGYFAAPGSGGLDFFPLTPCRVADTRASQGKTGAFGPPSLGSYVERDFPIESSSCNPPASAKAYSLNMTALPPGPLGFLSAWPASETYPGVSTLNSPTEGILANAAIVPAGTNGAIATLASNTTDLAIDINGTFAPPAGGGLEFYPATPCRLADTRSTQGFTGAFGPPSLTSYSSRNFPVLSGNCAIPSTAQAYAVNITAVPAGPLAFLSTWAAGQPYPGVSTLNSTSGNIIANAAIVPAGTSGEITIMTADPSDVIVDVVGYFAP